MSELYTLPDGWEWIGFSKVFDTLTSKPYQIQKTEYLENGLLPIIDQGKEFIIGYTNSIEKKYSNDSNCIIFGDHTRQIKYVDFDFVIGADGTKILKEKDKNKFDLKFLYFQFLSKKIESLGYSRHFKLVKEMFFSIPPLEEQKRIVAKLDILFAKIDKAIALYQKNVEEANVFMASVLNDVFVELEEKYPLKKVSDGLKNILTGTTPPTKEEKYYNEPSINWYSPSDFGKSKVLSISKNMINSIALTDKKAKIYEKNTLLLVAIGATVGKIGVIKEEASSNQQITAMKFKDDIDVDFSYYWFYYIKQIVINTASVATLPIINQSAIKDLKFIIPPLKTQQKVVSYLDEISQKMEKIKQIQKEKMQSLKALKASILDQAFKGEL